MRFNRIFIKQLALLVIICMVHSFQPVSFAQSQTYMNWLVTEQTGKLSLDSVNCSSGRINTVVSCADGIDEYGAALKLMNDASGVLCALEQAYADDSGRVVFDFALKEAPAGTYTMEIRSSDGSYIKAKMSAALPATAQTEELLQRVEESISQCEAKGISTDYEKMYANCVSRSLEIMKADADELGDAFVQYNVQRCNELLILAQQNLEAYLDGSAQAKVVPQVMPGTVKIDGDGFIAQVSDSSGTREAPVFLNGYNLGWEDRDDSDFLRTVGANIISYTAEIRDVIGAVDRPAGWEKNIGDKKGTNDIKTTDAQKRSGIRSLEIKNEYGSADYMYQTFTLQGGVEYTLSYKAKGADGTASAAYLSLGPTSSGKQVFELKPDTAWTAYSIKYTAAEDGTYMIAIGSRKTMGSIYLEDVSLKDPFGNEYVKNGGFDEYYAAVGADSDLGINSAAVETMRAALLAYKQKGYTSILTGNFAEMPRYILREIDGAKESTKKYSGFVQFTPTHPKVLEAIKFYCNAVLPVAEDTGCVLAFSIHNEPTYNSYDSEYYKPKWIAYIAEKYGGIAALNAAYGTAYSSFDEVPMPETNPSVPRSLLTVAYHDWTVFNDSILTEYHTKAAQYAHEAAPDMPVMTKIMQETHPVAAFTQSRGTDYEAFGGTMDINGNDGWAYVESYFGDMNRRPGVQNSMLWYDYQRGINSSPVFNAENHYLLDDEEFNFSPLAADWLRTELWQGALHGASANLVWLWGRSEDTLASFRNPTAQYRADCMAAFGKTTFDLNRLGEEITTLKNVKAGVAILYSENSVSYNRQYQNSLYKSYVAAMQCGVKTDIVTESKIGLLNRYKAVIIPEASHVSDATLDGIYDFVLNGGRVLMIGEHSLSYTPENTSRGEDQRLTAIKNAATVADANANFVNMDTSSAQNLDVYIKALAQQCGLDYTVCVDESGNAVSDLEITAADDAGGLLVNLCNYSQSTVNVRINHNGETVCGFENAENGDIYSDMIALEPYKPLLLKKFSGLSVADAEFNLIDFGSNAFSADASGAVVIRHDLAELAVGDSAATVKLFDEDGMNEVSIMYALKNSIGTLKGISYTECITAVGENTVSAALRIDSPSPGDYAEMYVWYTDSITPLIPCRRIRYQ